ncbi:MAG TPA: hypothetical protein VJK54_00900, partial [Chthoniobacterales bacterium]|nr:hypothetical protein [Chthoniobacterales bacterium]
LACADEVQGVDSAQKLSVHELLDASSTGATKQFTAEVEFGKQSTTTNPFTTMDGARVISLRNFATEKIHDSEGELLPAEAMLMIELEEGLRVVIRPSGTEPKIKFYLFASKQPDSKTFSPEELKAAKLHLTIRLEKLWQWLKNDALSRCVGVQIPS